MNKRIYLDHAATTYVRAEVLEEMSPFFASIYGNPSSIHSFGREARKAVETAREQVAKALNAQPNEIFFTSGGTEANNWALKGIAAANKAKGNHIITSMIEHHAVLHTCENLEKKGFEVTYLPVDDNGLLTAEQVKAAITDKTILISIMSANNEIGTLQPIEEIGKVAADNGIYFHTDAVQSIGSVKLDVKAMNIDALSLSAHKFYGPKGVGALYLKKGVKTDNLFHGGAQEKNRRAGTENISGIVGLGKAIELADANITQYAQRMESLRDMMIKGIMDKVKFVRLNGHHTKRLPGNANLSFEFIEGESLLLSLDMKGIAASSGSACTSGSLDPSHVLLAIGLSHEIAHGSLRLTFGDTNTEQDVEYVLNVLPGIVNRLRDMSPLFAQREEGPSYV